MSDMCITVRAVDPHLETRTPRYSPICWRSCVGLHQNTTKFQHSQPLQCVHNHCEVMEWLAQRSTERFQCVPGGVFAKICEWTPRRPPLDHLHASEMMLTVESQHRFAHHQSRPAVANREYGLTLGTGAPRRARVHEVGQLNL